jgi:signal transduction histidine kinase
MPKLPTARQSTPRALAAKTRAADPQSLAHAFLTFTQAAGSLEKSYAQLQAEVGRLRTDLECANGELSRSLEETSRMRAFLGRILEGLPCGVLVTEEQQPRMVNPEARRLLELDSDWNPERNGTCPAPIAQLLSDVLPGSAQSEQEWCCELLREKKTIGVSVTRAENSGSASETIWILRDISEQKRMAGEREAARRAHALAEIATVLAHEIRNPLGSMELFAGLLASSTRQMPEANQWVTHLQAGLRSLSATVNNVLQFHSQPGAELLPVSLDRLLRETAAFLGPLARQRGLDIRIENAVEAATVAADTHRLQQVFFNLSLNAFHAMDAGGTLTIRVRCAGAHSGAPAGLDFVQVDFQDQGRGIDRAARERIFEPGFTTKAGSPGLGLSVCRKVVEQHGGTIRVENPAHGGTTFSLLLPLRKGTA